MDLTVECYGATRRFPSAEIYGLCSQLQRAAVSIPANIAEGQRRQHKPEFVQHLFIANGSLAEVETHIQLAERLGYVKAAEAARLLERTGEVGRLLNGLLRFLRGVKGTSEPTTDHRPPTTSRR